MEEYKKHLIYEPYETIEEQEEAEKRWFAEFFMEFGIYN